MEDCKYSGRWNWSPSAMPPSRLLAACQGTLRLSVIPLAHSRPFGFVSDFGLRISDFRLGRAASVAPLRFIGAWFNCMAQIRWRLWLLPLVLVIPLNGLSQTTIRLAPCFPTNNLVLQRSANTLLHGTGPAGKLVHVRYKSPAGKKVGGPWKSIVAPSGTWKMELDLSSPVFDSNFDSKANGSLWISEEGKARKSFEIANVALGDVWLIAGWENQGIPVERVEFDDSCKSMVCFWGYQLIQSSGGPEAAETWPNASKYSRFLTLELRLAQRLALGIFTGRVGFVGIVRVRPEDLESGLMPEAASVPNDAISVSNNWNWVQEEVSQAQTNRLVSLIKFKHQGIVTNVTSITNYDVPAVFRYAAFSTPAPPANLFSFKGAIWPRHPKSIVR